MRTNDNRPAEERQGDWPHYELTAPMIGEGGQADQLHFLVGHWAQRYDDDRTLTVSPMQLRSEAVGHIDAMLQQLHQLRSALITEGREYEDRILYPKDLGECSREGCGRPAIEGKPGYVGPLYCGPRHAFIDRENRKDGAS